MTARPGTEAPGAGLDAVFSALADPTRRRLLQLLADGGPASASHLVAAFPFSRQAVVKHLQVLEAAGLVVPQREGREVRWHLRPAGLAPAAAWVAASGAAWDRRLARLRDLTREIGAPQASASPSSG